MFTGIVECTGTIADARSASGGRRLRIDAGPLAYECKSGASVCVSGVCLTVATAAGRFLEFDVVAETLNRSTLGSKSVGDRVNLERSLRIGDRLDGHFVQGHVDGTAVVDRVQASSSEHVAWFKPDDVLTPYIIPKGSICIDGSSLTIAAVKSPLFSVALIPTTLDRTTLSMLSSGDRVNLETDVITRTIVHRLADLSVASTAEPLTLNTLKEAGFV